MAKRVKATRKCRDCKNVLPVESFGFTLAGNLKSLCEECEHKRKLMSAAAYREKKVTKLTQKHQAFLERQKRFDKALLEAETLGMSYGQYMAIKKRGAL